MKTYQGLQVLITGASSGIGEAFARSLASKGANLILAARSLGKLETLKAELEKQYDISVYVLKVDLADVNAAKNLYQKIIASKLEVDILINNAGLGNQGRFERLSIDACWNALQVNVNSTVLLTRMFLPGMLKRRKGGIINLSSTAAFQPLPYFALYSATKSFILYFSESLWGEYHHRGVNILAVCPGHTKTGFHEKAGVNPNRLYLVSSSGDVAEAALDAFLKGRSCLVHGALNSFFSLLNRLFSRQFVINVSKNFFKPKFLGSLKTMS